MGSPRVKGNALSFLLDEADYWADAVSVVMDGEDEPVRILMAPDASQRIAWWFDVEAVQSTAAASFWTFLYEHEGQAIPFAYAPHGNPLPTPDEPHFTGVLTVPPPPRLGGAAGVDVEQTFTTRLPIVSGPLRVTTT